MIHRASEWLQQGPVANSSWFYVPRIKRRISLSVVSTQRIFSGHI